MLVIDNETKSQSHESSAHHRLSYHYDRKFRSYMFDNLDRIIDLTASFRIPEYIDHVPPQLEITGIFNWRLHKNAEHEYLILAFNGTNHLYCMNYPDCSRIDGYKPYLTQCIATFEIDSTTRLKPVQAIDHHARLDHLTLLKLSDSDEDYSIDHYSGKFHYSILILLRLRLSLIHFCDS